MSSDIANHKKIENDFFLLYDVEKESTVKVKAINKKLKGKIKKKSKPDKRSQDEIEVDTSYEDAQKVDPKNAVQGKIIASEYFNSIVVPSPTPITKSIVNKTDDYSKSITLFREEDTYLTNDSNSLRKPEEEGHSANADFGNSRIVLDIIRKFDTPCNYMNKDIFTTDVFLNRLIDNAEDEFPKPMTKFVPPALQNEQNTNIADKMFSIVINFDQIKYKHHSLFSIEHVLENRLIEIYNSSLKLKNEIKKMTELLDNLRSKKCDIVQSVQSTLKDNKKVYSNQDFIDCMNNIKKCRMSRFQKLIEDRNAEKNILSTWKNIKYIRKKLDVNNTGITLIVNKTTIDEYNSKKTWEENLELELEETIDELKCEYFQNKKKYNELCKKNKQLDNARKPKKPTLQYDKDNLRQTIEENLSVVLKQSNDPVLSFELKTSLEEITKTPTTSNEINRRQEVNKTKIFIKIYINHREVCKTNVFQLEQNFTVRINEKYTIHADSSIFSLKVLIFEKHSILPSHICYEMVIPIPEQSTDTKQLVYKFKNEMNKLHNHDGVGSGITVMESIFKKYPKLEIPSMDTFFKRILVFDGAIHLDLSLIQETSSDTTTNKNEKNEPNTKASVSNLIGTLLDPNNPENTFLSNYFNKIDQEHITSTEFYLDSNIYLNFKEGTQKSLRSIEDRVNRQLSPNKDGLSMLSFSKSSVKSNLSKATDRINVHRKNSIKYLQLINNYICQHIKNENEKTLNTILVDIQFPSLQTLTLNVLNPKTPLFHQLRQTSPTIQKQNNQAKDYILKICIFKAFHLPNRVENDSNSIQNNEEDGLLKMVSLRPFMYVNCQSQTYRTSTVIGNNPTWNEQLTFSVRYNPASMISFHLCDEVVENMLIDDRLEDSTLHYHYSAHWMASLKIPLANIISQNKVEGTYLMHCPLELLGYKFNVDEKYPASHKSYDSLRKEPSVKQRDEIFVSMHLEIFPTYKETLQAQLCEKLNSNEMDAMLQHLNYFTLNYTAQFPNRKLNMLVIDSTGKNICITRFFHPIALFDLGECLKVFGTTPRDDLSSSKNSSLKKKFMKKDMSSIQSIFSVNVNERRRQSKSTKEEFEMKTIDENTIESDELTLAIKVQICARFVAMIPLHNSQLMHNQFVVLSAPQILKLAYGTMIDHTILLMGYFLGLGIECWCVAGNGLHGFSTYVLIRENANLNEISMRNTFKNINKSLLKQISWRYVIYDATTAKRFDTKDPFCPLHNVYFICNNDNIWVNIQIEDRCNLVKFNLSNTSEWRPVFQKDGIVTCPEPLPSIISNVNEDTPLYTYDENIFYQLRDLLEDKIIHKVQKWRSHRKTTWNRYCSKVLRDTLPYWEKWCLNTASPRPKHSSQLQQLMLAYEIYGFPLNLSYTTISDIVSTVKGTQLHLNEHSDVEFALGVEVFPYPNFVYSIWIYLATIVKK